MDETTRAVLNEVKAFYKTHNEIKESHGMEHINIVFSHAQKALSAQIPLLSSEKSMKVLVASLLHDVDDKKYFPSHKKYENSIEIMTNVRIPDFQQEDILQIISFVSCSTNRNSVPDVVSENDAYWMLIPRWCDRLDAVGTRGVIRCYQYSKEAGRPLSSESSPKPKNESDIWNYATPERFERYEGDSSDMISHYYDKLLHVARPPPDMVRNSYLQDMATKSSQELIQVCLKYAKSGNIYEIEAYINSLSL